MDEMFWYRYLFLLIFGIFVFARSLKKPATTNIFNVLLAGQLRYEKTGRPTTLKPIKVALVVFLGLNAGLLGIWLLAHLNASLLKILYAIDVGMLLALLTQSTNVLGYFKDHAYRLAVVAAGILFGALGLTWIFVPIWPIYSMIAFLVGYIMLSQVGVLRLRYVFALLIASALYDLWGVWGSALVIGNQSGIIGEIALGMNFTPPGMIIVPQNILAPWSTASIGKLGIGDVVIPGFAVLAASRFHLEKETIVGFAVGLLLTLAVLVLIRRPMPATILLNPSVLLAILVAARARRIQLEW